MGEGSGIHPCTGVSCSPEKGILMPATARVTLEDMTLSEISQT